MRNFFVFDKSVFHWFLIDFLSRPVTKKLMASLLFLLSIILVIITKKQLGLSLIMKAQRFYPNIFYTNIMAKLLPHISPYYQRLMPNDIQLSAASARSIVLKMPKVIGGNISKGIVVITYTDTNRYYFYNVNVKELMKYFYVVLEPSSAGYCLPEILFWAAHQNPVFVQSTEITDREFLGNIKSNLLPLEFGASDWVNYNKFYPFDAEKNYDSIYIANYNPVKRLHIYFNALRKIKNRGIKYKGAIVCARWGGHRDAAMKLIDYYNVSDILDVHERFDAAQLNDVLNHSGCNILLSLKEGSNRSLFEAMFSDVPVIALKNNVGINKDYINKSTGMLINDNKLADALLLIRTKRDGFTPRQWALENISPEVTTGKLINIIRSIDASFLLEDGDVLVKTNDPEVAYLDKDSGVDKEYFMESVLKLLDKKGEVQDCEQKMLALSDEFYHALATSAERTSMV